MEQLGQRRAAQQAHARPQHGVAGQRVRAAGFQAAGLGLQQRRFAQQCAAGQDECGVGAQHGAGDGARIVMAGAHGAGVGQQHGAAAAPEAVERDGRQQHGGQQGRIARAVQQRAPDLRFDQRAGQAAGVEGILQRVGEQRVGGQHGGVGQRGHAGGAQQLPGAPAGGDMGLGRRGAGVERGGRGTSRFVRYGRSIHLRAQECRRRELGRS